MALADSLGGPKTHPMFRKLLALCLLALVITAGCRREPAVEPDNGPVGDVLKQKPDPTPAPQGDPLSREELDRVVVGKLEEKNDFQWPMVDLRTLWSATLYN